MHTWPRLSRQTRIPDKEIIKITAVDFATTSCTEE